MLSAFKDPFALKAPLCFQVTLLLSWYPPAFKDPFAMKVPLLSRYLFDFMVSLLSRTPLLWRYLFAFKVPFWFHGVCFQGPFCFEVCFHGVSAFEVPICFEVTSLLSWYLCFRGTHLLWRYLFAFKARKCRQWSTIAPPFCLQGTFLLFRYYFAYKALFALDVHQFCIRS